MELIEKILSDDVICKQKFTKLCKQNSPVCAADHCLLFESESLINSF